MNTHYTSVIGLSPKHKKQYIALHNNTFAGVLKRIAMSNIGNYSIFLHDDLLFSHYEYSGKNYKKDMAEMGKDATTREWWSLTEPMQKPFEDREKDEWWSDCNILFSNFSKNENKKTTRKAYIATISKDIKDLKNKLISLKFNNKIIIANYKKYLFVYMELEKDSASESKAAIDKIKKNISKEKIKKDFKEMQQVFFTDMKNEKNKKVFISGCFDMLHSGHIAFIQEAASYGDLYIGIGSDKTVHQLKGRYPINTQEERLYMLNALKDVKKCFVNSGSGILDFTKEIEEIKPDIFIVNEDGNTPQKAQMCAEKGIEYKVLKRIPHASLPKRSTTDLRTISNIPYRIDLAGGWLDQPYVSKFHKGPVLTISIEPNIDFNHRSGMATSTRNKAVELWKSHIPEGDYEQLAKILFTFDNPPGTEYVSGSQDAIGIVFPFLNKLNYNGDYWPESIDTINDESIISWMESSIYLIPLGPRKSNYDVLTNTEINAENAKLLSDAAENCWESIKNKDFEGLGKYFTESFMAQIKMFPNMVDDEIFDIIEKHKNKALGWKLSGAGGGGYLIFISNKKIKDAIQIKIRRGLV